MPDPTADTPQIGFFKLTVSDLDKSRAFYEAAFGMTAGSPIVQRDLSEQVMKSPENSFAVTLLQYADGRAIETADGSVGAPPFYVGFYVRDMPASIARAEAAGAKLLRGPDYFGQVSFAFLKSPDGHVIELIDRGDD